MRLLLDTHILLWSLEDSDQLPAQARELMFAADKVYASTVNLWEIVIKLSIGKLKLAIDHRDLIKAITDSGFDMLPIKPDHAIKLKDLDDHHRDPFDRMLVAQSLAEPLHLVTCDALVAAYGGNVIKI